MPIENELISNVLKFLGSLVLGYTLSYFLMRGLAHASRGSYTALRIFLLPGIMVHELSHALACLVTATPIERISFWTEAGGEVVHHKPKLAVITQPLIAFAPFPVGILLLLLVSSYLSFDHWLLSVILILLMVSIAATLAPSKADAINGLEGLVILLLLIGVLYYFYPELFAPALPYLKQFTNRLLFIDAILGGMWITVTLFHKSLHRFA